MPQVGRTSKRAPTSEATAPSGPASALPGPASALPGPAPPDLCDLLGRPTTDVQAIRTALDEGRRRTWMLVSGLDDEALGTAAVPYLSPPVWDLGHIANFEELWLVQNILDRGELRPGHNGIYDALAHPRQERPSLALMDPEGCRRYHDEVRGWSLGVLDDLDLSSVPLTQNGFIHWLIVLHEHQHQETLLQSIQMHAGRYQVPAVRDPPAPRVAHPGVWCDIPGGPFTMGRPHGPRVYDNESGPHEVDLPPFRMAQYPVTCGQHLRFLEEGGYEDRDLWSPEGRAWLDEQEHRAPLHWEHHDGQWHRRGIRGTRPVDEVPDEILCHVSYWEAEAHARFRDARLPTEPEWEKAARSTGSLNPWGDGPADTARANVDHLAWGPSRVGSHPAGRSGHGVEQLIGDVWEWCASGFQPYPGFQAYPYREYSEIFFGGDFRMLRGGSWATRASCAHGAFRNWDHPHRRQVFAGIRLVQDV